MSLKYRDSQGNETPVAGLNGTSGELIPSVSLAQSGTAHVYMPSTSALTDLFTVDVTFDTPFEDTDYVLNVDECSVSEAEINRVYNKTVNGFTIAVMYNRKLTAVPSYTVTAHIPWQAFKLMTDEVHEADSAHMAQNTANFAPAFSNVTSYAVGDYVTYNNVLYRCTTAHTAGVWVAGHFTQVTVGGTLGAVVPSDASASNKLVTESEAELSTIPLSKFQVSSGGAVGYADLGATNSQISQAYSWLEVEYGRVDDFIDKYFISISGTSSNLNYIRVVRLAGLGQTPTITLDANKHIWMSMDTYVYIRVRAYGNFSISGTLSRTAPTGTTVPIDRLVTESELNTYAKPHIYNLSGAEYVTLQALFDKLITQLKADAVGQNYGICFMGTWTGKSFFEGSFYTVDGHSSYFKITFQNPQDSKYLFTGYTGYSDTQVTYHGVA